MEQLLQGLFIPIIATVGFAFYTFQVMVLKNTKLLENGVARNFKDKEKYRDMAGKLLLMMTIVSAVSTVLTQVSETASFVVFLIGLVVFLFLWKRMHDQYGW